jgi:hypothetical protein
LPSPIQPGAQQAVTVIVAEAGAIVLQRAVPHEEGDRRVDLDDVLLDGDQAKSAPTAAAEAPFANSSRRVTTAVTGYSP